MKNIPLAALMAVLAATPVLAQDQIPGANFIANWDADGNGAVSLEEATTRRGDIFTAFDADEDGFLSAEEYDLLDEARAVEREAMQAGQGNGQGNGNGQGKGYGKGFGFGFGKGSEKGMERGFCDADTDGKVSRDEFMARVPDWFAMMDRTGEGTITTDDFGPGN